MEIYIRNRNRDVIGMIDNYESLIWTPRYYEPGDFEVYTRATEESVSLLKLDNYVMKPDSDMVGIIESVQITTHPEEGDYIIAKGRCAKSILERRILWGLSGADNITVELAIRKFVSENIVSPAMSARKIDHFVLGELRGFTEKITAQYTGDNLLEVVVNLCKQYGIGFKVVLNDDGDFELQLYKGEDRSYNQTVNSWVVFSPEFENIMSSDYSHDKSTLKNACLIAGEGEALSRDYTFIGLTRGLDRRELFVDARDVTSETEGGEKLSTSDYYNLLEERGCEELAENLQTITFEGEVESSRQFVFGRDYNLGDIVTVKNQYGITVHPRVIEVIQSHDENGLTVIPTFSTVGEVVTTILDNQVIELDEEGWGEVEVFSPLIDGEEYTVIFNGKEYMTTATTMTVEPYGTGIALGNKAIFGGEDTGENFIIGYARSWIAVIAWDDSTKVTLSIIGPTIKT